jgi:protein-tyrosine phosphatase
VNSHIDGAGEDRTRVLFVCLGNICRSPLAEAVFLALLEEQGLLEDFEVDSAGTGSWHVGDPPDPRSVAVARDNGIDLRGRARQITPDDLAVFDWIIAMDDSNLSSIASMARSDDKARLHRLREFDDSPDDGDVPDPYYGGPGGFDEVFDIVDRSCRRFLDHMKSDPD